MIVIATAATLTHVLKTGCDPGLARILERYSQFLAEEDLALLYLLHPGDRARNLETLRGYPFQNWEFIAFEAGWYEAVFVLDDYGHGHVVLMPDSTECDPILLNICREHAVSNG
jgi:hypothetical protein